MTLLPTLSSRVLRPALVAAALLLPCVAAQAAPAAAPGGLAATAPVRPADWDGWGWGPPPPPPPYRWGRPWGDDWRWRHRWREEQAWRWRQEEIRREEARRRAMYGHRGWDGDDWY
jgi:hypothetical protein